MTLLPAERGDRILFGRTYHWHYADRLVLVAGSVDDCDDCDQGGAS